MRRVPVAWLRQPLGYACWVASSVGWLLVGLQLRPALLVLAAVLGANRWVLRALDMYGVVVIVLTWLIAAMVTEPYYSTGAREGDLRRRFALVTAVQVGIGLLLVFVPGAVEWLARQ